MPSSHSPSESGMRRAALAIALGASIFGETASAPESGVALSSDIRVPSARWAALESALSCWTSRGSWVAHGDGFEWVPDRACPQYTTRVTGGVACGIAAELQALYPAHKRGLPDRALFVGDSITHQYFRGFISNAPRSAVHVPIPAKVNTYSGCGRGRLPLPIRDCEAGGAPLSLTALYRRADRLALWPACGSKNETVGFTDAEWVSEFPGTSVIFINRGAHYEDDAKFAAGWRAALHLVRQRAPRALVVARTTPGGHDSCTKFASPVASSSLAQKGYSWKKMPGQNALLRKMVQEEFPGVILLDIEYLASLRPDAHVGVDKSKGGKLDCLHYREGGRAAGAMNAPHFLLYNALQLLGGLQKERL